MKRKSLAAIMVIIGLALVGCGHDHSSAPPPTRTVILSDPTVDGTILQTSPTTFTITQGMIPPVQSVFAGIDPSSLQESRAFLDFPLTGPGGVPGNATIVSATLDIVINNISPTDITIPIRIELVSLPTLLLVSDDFSRTLRPAIEFTTIIPPIAFSDVGRHVPVDVTSLMVQAQGLGLLDFQVRILEDLGLVSPGLIEINDTTDPAIQGTLAPALQVEYF